MKSSKVLTEKKNQNIKDPHLYSFYAFQLICKDTTLEFVVDGYLPFKYITAGKF